MSTRRSLAIALILSSTISRGAPAQRLTDALIGSRVRLDTSDGSLVTGTVVSIDADSIRLTSSSVGTTLSLPRAKVLSIEVSAGRERARGAKRGAIVGGVFGLALVVASLQNDTATVNRHESDVAASVSVGIGILALGAGIGAALAPERWESPSRVSARLRLAACPGSCIALRYRF